MTIYKIILVGLGGMLGSIMRYITSKSIDERLNAWLPYGTLTVNIIGSFILGIVYAWVAGKTNSGENTKLFLATGFCGGFTTFSAFAFENLNMVQQKMFGSFLLYTSISVVTGLLAVASGIALGKSLQ